MDGAAEQQGAGRLPSVMAWATGLGLVGLHLLPWRPPAELWFGWLPAEMGWRLAWTLLAWIWLVWFCARVWVGEPRA